MSVTYCFECHFLFKLFLRLNQQFKHASCSVPVLSNRID